MRESEVECKVVQWAKEHGVISIKLNGPGDVGKPDRLFLHGGKAVFVEFKAPCKRPSLIQQRWLNDLGDAGFLAFWSCNPTTCIIELEMAFGI